MLFSTRFKLWQHRFGRSATPKAAAVALGVSGLASYGAYLFHSARKKVKAAADSANAAADATKASAERHINAAAPAPTEQKAP